MALDAEESRSFGEEPGSMGGGDGVIMGSVRASVASDLRCFDVDAKRGVRTVGNPRLSDDEEGGKPERNA